MPRPADTQPGVHAHSHGQMAFPFGQGAAGHCMATLALPLIWIRMGPSCHAKHRANQSKVIGVGVDAPKVEALGAAWDKLKRHQQPTGKITSVGEVI